MSGTDVGVAIDNAIAAGAHLYTAEIPLGPPLPRRSIPIVRGEAAIDLVCHALAHDSELAIFESAWLGTSASGGGVISFRSVAEWILRQRLQGRTTTSIVDRLFAFARQRTAECWQVRLINGLVVESRIELGDDFFLLPLNDIPDEFSKSWIKFGNYQQFLAHSCIVKRATFIALNAQTPSVDSDSTLEHHKIFHEIRRSLSLIGPCAPIEVGQTAFLIDAPGSDVGGGGGYQQHEVSTTASEPQIIRAEEAEETVAQYLNLKPSDRAKLHVGIDRLGLALRRHHPSDRAIELGIALESLLLADSDAKDQIALPLRLRGAWLTSETLAERLERERLLSKVYSLRSKAVHRGMIALTPETEATLKEGSRLCALVVRKLVERKCKVDWTKLILGAPEFSTAP